MTATCKHCSHLIAAQRDTILDGLAQAREMEVFGNAVFQHLATRHPEVMKSIAEAQVMFSSWNMFRHLTGNQQLAVEVEAWKDKLFYLLSLQKAEAEEATKQTEVTL